MLGFLCRYITHGRFIEKQGETRNLRKISAADAPVDLDRPVEKAIAKSKLTPTKKIVLLPRLAVIYLSSTIPVPDLTHLSKHKEPRGECTRLYKVVSR